MKAQSQQAVQGKVIQAMALNPTAHLPANQSSNLNSVVVSDVETNMTAMLHARLRMLSACTARKQKVCMKKHLKQVHEIVQSPEYQGQEIHLHDDSEETSDSSSVNSCDEDEGTLLFCFTRFLGLYTALWMYRTTPLSDQMPSPHELLFGRKPQTTLPRSRSALKSKHPDDDLHQEANQARQERQAVFYDRKAGTDQKALNTREPVSGTP
ncbi:hypothetical protein ACROYT_G012565 [Oculina patagonica]